MSANRLTTADAFGYKERGRGWPQLLNVVNVASLFPLPGLNCALRVGVLVQTVRHENVSGGYVCAQLARAACDAMASSYYLPVLFMNLCVDSVASVMDQQEHLADGPRRGRGR